MKKLLFVLTSLIFVGFNLKAELTRIDFEWTKIIPFSYISLSEKEFNQGKIGKVENGQLYIKYKDFGTAGSLCTVSIDAGLKDTALNGNKVTKLEDVIVIYDPTTGTLIIMNKLKENLLWIIANEKTDNLLLFYDILPFLN